MSQIDYQQKYFDIGNVFTPGSPVNEKDLFAGRIKEISKVITATSQRGYHAVLYGERGVGKTSLANIINQSLPSSAHWMVLRVNCDGTDSYSSLWRKAFAEITMTDSRQGIGFGAVASATSQTLADTLPEKLSPADVRRAAERLVPHVRLLFVFDEYDRLSDKKVSILMADTIKNLSDYSLDATVLLIGVADSVDDLVAGHQSIERALIQIPMPRMSSDEVLQIVDGGFKRMGMEIGKSQSEELTSLSQGLPYITHLLSLESGRAALRRGSLTVEQPDVDKGIQNSLENWQQTTTKSYYDAVQSSQPGNIYKEVLLSCALAEADDFGFFTASAVRTPLRSITGKEYDIPGFAQHLKNFSDPARGSIIQRIGNKRIRYRFMSPLHRPYIVMRGFRDGLLTRQQMKKMSATPVD